VWQIEVKLWLTYFFTSLEQRSIWQTVPLLASWNPQRWTKTSGFYGSVDWTSFSHFCCFNFCLYWWVLLVSHKKFWCKLVTSLFFYVFQRTKRKPFLTNKNSKKYFAPPSKNLTIKNLITLHQKSQHLFCESLKELAF
jgi:hypothetical protein